MVSIGPLDAFRVIELPDLTWLSSVSGPLASVVGLPGSGSGKHRRPEPWRGHLKLSSNDGKHLLRTEIVPLSLGILFLARRLFLKLHSFWLERYEYLMQSILIAQMIDRHAHASLKEGKDMIDSKDTRALSARNLLVCEVVHTKYMTPPRRRDMIHNSCEEFLRDTVPILWAVFERVSYFAYECIFCWFQLH